MSGSVDIAALRALAANATPGPLKGFNLADVFTDTHPRGEGDIHVADFDPDPTQRLSVETVRANRELFMVARTAIPLLCDEVERLRAMVHPFTSRDELNAAFRNLNAQRDAAISGRAEMAESALALAEKERDEARAALEFYAEPLNYASSSTGFALQYDPEPSPIMMDLGARARKAAHP